MNKTWSRGIAVAALAFSLGAGAVPVHGYFQVHSFFNPNDKYRQWFDADIWRRGGETPVARPVAGPVAEPVAGPVPGVILAAAGGAEPAPVAPRYPYPDKRFVMTEERWRKSVAAVQTGKPDWFDAEVVRQRAEVEEFPPAMDLLGWMYENGRGVNQDKRRAYTWYERAKLAGEAKVRGETSEIFKDLAPPEQFYAELQLAEDIERMKQETETALKRFETVKLHVLKQQRELDSLRKRYKRDKRRVKAIHR